MRSSVACLTGIVFAFGAPVFGVAPTATEFAARDAWVAAKLSGDSSSPRLPVPTLVMVENNDPVQENGRNGKPLRIGTEAFARGLYCHANSKVIVRNLPKGAKSFHAAAGVDSNEQTSGGRGSVIFIVEAGGKQLFKSNVCREGSPSLPINVVLDGAPELTLIVTDGGDGISCDQADWGNAYVTLADGTKLWLGDVPFADGPKPTKEPFLSLQVDGQPFFQGAAAPERHSQKLDDHRVRHELVWKKDQLIVRCEAVEYRDFPTVEWTAYVKNAGPTDSPMIENLQAIDTTWRRDAAGEFVLHHNTGSPCLPIDYQPHAQRLGPKEAKRITTSGGRSTNSDLPFFNIEWSGEGVIVALGWPGQWAASFTRDVADGLQVSAGQELTRFRLHPGDEVRTPLVVVQFYDGEVARAQNVWRRWMIAHNMPLPSGKPVPPMTGACSSHQFHEMIQANDTSQKLFIDRYVEEKLGLDYWWMDAGWYVNSGDWPNTGTWTVDRKRFPGGLRAITNHAHAKGVKSIVWFEPERVNPGTELYEKHPEFLLGQNGRDKLLNLGNPAAAKWWLERADALINSEGIDLYRNDFNIDPLAFWRANDAPDRQGITEIRYVEGFLGYWDELRKRHPNMLIDTCASGGRRNDLETLRRAVPLLRSDYILEPVGQQNHTMGIASWIPFFGTGINTPDPYTFRSQMCPWLICCYDMRRTDLDYAALRKLHGDWKRIAPLFLKDFYLLTPYTTENTAWVAWQFDNPESGEGVVLVFRRAESIYESASLKLHELDETARYKVEDLDTDSSHEVDGRNLTAGLAIALPQQPQAKILLYHRVTK